MPAKPKRALNRVKTGRELTIMAKHWTADRILELASGYKASCVLAAAADLQVFDFVADEPVGAEEVADKLGADLRGTTILLDALTAIGMLEKAGGLYVCAAGVARTMTAEGDDRVLAMAQHQANCLRRWAQIAKVVKTGRPAEREPSVRGEDADKAAFIGAMHDINVRVADTVVADVESLAFSHLLDIGGASGTWTIAFLRSHPEARATIFDLPHVIPLAEHRLSEEKLRDRVNLVVGDFYADKLPKGADLALVSAIVHQNSREQNRELFRKAYDALDPGGHILIRDILMDESRTSPTSGALFAVNMLVATEGGGTYTFDELSEDLASAGFADAEVLRADEWMDSLVLARKP